MNSIKYILVRPFFWHHIRRSSCAFSKLLPALGYLLVGATMTIGIGLQAARCDEVALVADPGLQTRAVRYERIAIVSTGISGEHRDLKALWRDDPAIRNYVGLSECSWDFNAPGGVPGFGPLDSKPEN